MQDLRAIMDQTSPGSYSLLKAYCEQFGSGNRESQELLDQHLLDPLEAQPPTGSRRLKKHVGTELPPKQELLLPALMP